MNTKFFLNGKRLKELQSVTDEEARAARNHPVSFQPDS